MTDKSSEWAVKRAKRVIVGDEPDDSNPCNVADCVICLNIAIALDAAVKDAQERQRRVDVCTVCSGCRLGISFAPYCMETWHSRSGPAPEDSFEDACRAVVLRAAPLAGMGEKP